MNAIRIRTMVRSETLHLPEIKPLVGKAVEIIVLEEPQATETSGKDWQPLFDLAGKDLIDPEAYKQLRAASLI